MSSRVDVLLRRTALVVEDDPRVQREMTKQLGQLGFHVRSALHYDAAVIHLAGRKPHLVCVDVFVQGGASQRRRPSEGVSTQGVVTLRYNEGGERQ